MEDTKTIEYLKKFDVVFQHIFEINTKGSINLPVFMDAENYKKTVDETLELHKQGQLVTYYNRLKKGAV